MTATHTDYRDRLAAAAARLRESGELGRSEPLVRLFDFLLECSLAGRAPKEIEVAQEVFGKTTDFDAMQDASVRVYVHRLRRKLSEHYSRAQDAPDQISVPLGEYRMVLASAQPMDDIADLPEVAEILAPRSKSPFVIALIGLALVNALAWGYFVRSANIGVGSAQSVLWKPISDNLRPTLVVTGDYYIFGEAPDGLVVSRLVRDFAINSREELDEYLLGKPDKVGRYVDLELHYLPTSTGRALGSLLPVISAASSSSALKLAVENMSEVKPEVFKSANIVYVGFLSGLGPLQDPLFRASGFKIGENFDELVDKASGRHFRSDWGVVADGKSPQRDYGYIAGLRGPSGNRIVIVAGTRDPAVMQMAETAVDQQQLATIAAKVGEQPFEALFEVRTQGNLNLGSSLVLARPMHDESIWRPEQRSNAGVPD